jgi:hypothetical protein
MDDPKLEPHFEHATEFRAAFQSVFRIRDLVAKLQQFLEPMATCAPTTPRSIGRPRKSKWEKETTEILGHCRILKDAGWAEYVWTTCEPKDRSHKDLTAKQLAYILKDHAGYGRADIPRIRNRLSAAKIWLDAHS